MKTINNKILYFAYSLFLLIPLSLITGPFIPDLFLVIISLIFFVFTFKDQNFALIKNKYSFFIIFCLVIITISIFSSNLSSFKSAIFYFRFGLFSIATYVLIKSNQQIFKSLFYLFIIIYSSLLLIRFTNIIFKKFTWFYLYK